MAAGALSHFPVQHCHLSDTASIYYTAVKKKKMCLGLASVAIYIHMKKWQLSLCENLLPPQHNVDQNHWLSRALHSQRFL